jgi:hypothetical protein
MIDKPVYIIMFMFVASWCFLGAQFIADSWGVTLRNYQGDPLESAVVDFVSGTDLNEASTILLNSTDAAESTFTLDPIFAGATFAWEMFQLFLGVYIFNLIFFFGVPPVYIVPITITYIVMLFIFVVAKIRGV